MKIPLPSMGILGTKVVEMRQPVLDDLRAMNTMNQESELMKVQFVQRLVDTDFTKITDYDLEYLYIVGAFAASMNTIQYYVTCPKCGAKHKYNYTFGSEDLLTLPAHTKSGITRVINKVGYTFNVISAQDKIDILDYAISCENDEFEDAVEDGIAAKVLGISFVEVKKLPIQVYLAAHLYHKVVFHGVKLVDKQVCDKCNQKLSTAIDVPPSILKVNLKELMDDYAAVSSNITFEAFIKLSIPEYNSFIDTLMEQYNGN